MKKHSLYKFILLGAFMLFMFVASFAQSSVKVLPRPTNPIRAVNDFANVFSYTQKDSLERLCRKIYDASSNEVVVLTLPSLDGYEVDDVTYAYVKNWNFGNKAKDNGILVFLSKEPRKVRIEIGRGLEGALPDGLAGTIIRREMVPYLKQGLFYDAFSNGINGVDKAIKGEYKMDDPSDRRDRGNKGKGSFTSILLMMLVVFIILIIISKRGGGGGNGGMLTRRGYRRWGGPTVFDYGPWMGGGSSGGGIFGDGGSSSGGGFGDFGGFGGGDFGGGGASGDW